MGGLHRSPTTAVYPWQREVRLTSAHAFALALAVGSLGAAPVALSACAPLSAAPVATPTPTETPLPTPTATISFSVGVGAPSPTPDRPKPTPRPTRFKPPLGPYIVLSASTGPVGGRRIVVRGGNLPAGQQVSLLWSPRTRGTGIATITYTNTHGAFAQQVTVPPALPGPYRISAQIDGVTYASGGYRVVSSGEVGVTVVPTTGGDAFDVTGNRFQPRQRLLLVAYSLTRGVRPVILGRAKTDARGRLSFRVSRRLQTGEYALHVFSTEGLSADLASTYFQVQV